MGVQVPSRSRCVAFPLLRVPVTMVQGARGRQPEGRCVPLLHRCRGPGGGSPKGVASPFIGSTIRPIAIPFPSSCIYTGWSLAGR